MKTVDEDYLYPPFFHLLFFLFRSFVNQETYNQYRNCYNDVTDFMTILRGQYIDIIRSFNVREPVYEITEQSQYRIPYSGTERRVKQEWP